MRCSILLICCLAALGVKAAELSGKSAPLAQEQVSPPLPTVSPPPPSRWDYFRRLLTMTPAEQEQALAGKAETQRRVLLDKIQEYGNLPLDEREARLRLVELYDHLVPLMKLPPEQRAEKLALVPEKDRPLVEERLRQWDLLKPLFPDKDRENEMTIRYFLRLEHTAPPTGQAISNNIPETSRKYLEETLERWRAIPVERRQKMVQQVQQFFAMPPNEKAKTLKTLPDGERQKMERSLEAFAVLPPQQQRICIEAFHKFANMTKPEMTQFLKNSERWQEMSPQDRETWRNLVNLLPGPAGPPMPGSPEKAPPVGKNPLPGANNGSNALPNLPGH